MSKSHFLRGIKISIPIILGYFPVGFTFGILALHAHFSPLAILIMSYFVYAGSAQLIVINMLINGSNPISAVIATGIINLRYMLMSAAVTPYLKNWSKPLQAWFCFEMTDETFALNLNRFIDVGVNKSEVLGLNSVAHLAWAASCFAGSLAGNLLEDIKPYGLDFALPGMFLGLLLPYLTVPPKLLAALLGGCLSIILFLLGADQWSVIIATAIAATIVALLPFKKEHMV